MFTCNLHNVMYNIVNMVVMLKYRLPSKCKIGRPVSLVALENPCENSIHA